ncbi:MAG: secretion protein [Oceanicoccus sp.]|uniref:CAP family protein n=1 Tax=Oceanicoccus sp. TaxID=2691044 RepID=UPI00261AA476|nr:CAP family protein [Oceanicoccus sp.]MCP3907230.1 secretion protein [Oceanicoccus sp.]
MDRRTLIKDVSRMDRPGSSGSVLTEGEVMKQYLVFLLALASVGLIPIETTAATSQEIQKWLQAHNEYRVLHRAATVSWSNTVAASAQGYANTCPSGHSSSGYGENLAWASYSMDESQVVKMWYDEEPLYDYTNPGFSSGTGHFTQVVWKSTTEIGCALSTGCDANWPYMANAWVCQYNPPGNYTGRFAENVSPPNTTGGSNTTGGAGAIAPVLHLLLTE